MNRMLALGTLLLLALVVASCGDDSTTNPAVTVNPIEFTLAVGNTWVYDLIAVARGGTVDSTRISGTQMYEGESYWVLDDLNDPGEAFLVRQTGQELWVVPSFTPGAARGPDPIEAWIDSVLEASYPWKLADFAAASVVSWAVAAAETTIDVARAPAVLSVDVTGSSLGRESVTVPAGTFNDVYHGRVSLSLSLDGIPAQQFIQDLWIHEGTGIVKSRDTESEVLGPGPEIEDSDLVSFELAEYSDNRPRKRAFAERAL